MVNFQRYLSETKAANKYDHNNVNVNYSFLFNIPTVQRFKYYSRLKRVRAFLQLCKQEACSTCSELIENTTDESLLHTIYDMSIKLQSVMMLCAWRNNMIPCSQNFRTILTEEGICFTFNSLNSEDIYSKEYDSVSAYSIYIQSIKTRF